jgi:hypothetical protein
MGSRRLMQTANNDLTHAFDIVIGQYGWPARILGKHFRSP